MSRPYPPAPWHLSGQGVQLVQTVDVRDVRRLVPPELSIVSVWPGRTLGVVAFAHYGPGSVLEYDELIIAPAIVRYRGQWGVWVSHIYVNHPLSVQGGRELWGVPKELADFRWHDDGRSASVEAIDQGRTICRVSMCRRWWMGRHHLAFPTFSQLGGQLIRFIGDTTGRIGWGKGELHIDPSAPFGKIRFGKPRLSLWVQEMTLVCGEPNTVGATGWEAGMDRFVAQPAMFGRSAAGGITFDGSSPTQFDPEAASP
ncbi:acetoacetate decarboxylase family protein [bacterium]|nr:acetoacetate decarboxylase family protein [bacterium]